MPSPPGRTGDPTVPKAGTAGARPSDSGTRRTIVDIYGSNYTRFAEPLYAEIRSEAFGEDLGSNSWLTAQELAGMAASLGLTAASRALDVGCGAGGPAIRLAQRSGCRVVGIDRDERAILQARSAAAANGLGERVRFDLADATGSLAFGPDAFDALVCVDALNHLPDRRAVFAQWARWLKPGGRLFFSDPIVLTGPVSAEEILLRASIGSYLFLPDGENERLLAEAGLRLLRKEDKTESVAVVAQGRRQARSKRAEELRKIEGEALYEGQQRFLETCETLARERRLSRFVYLAERSPEHPGSVTSRDPAIRRLGSEAEAGECARMMAASEPWVTLGRDEKASLAFLRDATRERYVAIEDGAVAGFLVLNMQGAFAGYVQTICVAPHARRKGLGTALLRFAEERVFRESPNVFLCVSDFNPDARRLYERLGYRSVGELTDYIVSGHAEILMRKTIGPRTGAAPAPGGTQ